MLVSIVMAVHNGQDFVQEAIDSILSQTYSELELIVVNDASTDGTIEILEKVTDERVKVFHLQENKGGAYALNVGIDQAEGEWIAIHDADDISYLNRIEEQVDFLKQNPSLVAVGSFIECISGRNDPLPKHSLEALEGFINRSQSSEELRLELYSRCALTHGTMMYSKRAFLKVGKYDPHLRVTYDYDLWTRLSTIGPIKKIPKKLYKYRLHKYSITNKNVNRAINELFYCCTKHIRRTCYENKKQRPSIVVFGPRVRAKNFALQAKSNIKVLKISNTPKLSYLEKTLTLFNQKQLDGVIILSNSKWKDSLLKYFTDHGLVLNKNLFEFWVWC